MSLLAPIRLMVIDVTFIQLYYGILLLRDNVDLIYLPLKILL